MSAHNLFYTKLTPNALYHALYAVKSQFILFLCTFVIYTYKVYRLKGMKSLDLFSCKYVNTFAYLVKCSSKHLNLVRVQYAELRQPVICTGQSLQLATTLPGKT